MVEDRISDPTNLQYIHRLPYFLATRENLPSDSTGDRYLWRSSELDLGETSLENRVSTHLTSSSNSQGEAASIFAEILLKTLGIGFRQYELDPSCGIELGTSRIPPRSPYGLCEMLAEIPPSDLIRSQVLRKGSSACYWCFGIM